MPSSASSMNSYFDRDNIIAREHLNNFFNLPFHIYFTNPYSPLPPHLTSLNLQAFFCQIPASAVPIPSSPPQQRLVLVPTEYHFRYIIDRRPRRIIQAPTSRSTSSILPHYSTPSENPPDYQGPPNQELLLRRIRILERDSIVFRNRSIADRDQQISQLYTDTDPLITEHQSRNTEEIDRCEELLNI